MAPRPGRTLRVSVFALAPIPIALWMLFTPSTTLAFALNALVALTGAAWLGVGGSTVQDLVLPRMRGSASALYILSVTLIGLALGPFTVGLVSDWTGDLRVGLVVGLSANLVAMLFLALAAAVLEREEGTLRQRAREAGETGV